MSERGEPDLVKVRCQGEVTGVERDIAGVGEGKSGCDLTNLEERVRQRDTERIREMWWDCFRRREEVRFTRFRRV